MKFTAEFLYFIRQEENIMIIVLKENPDKKQLDDLTDWLHSMDFQIHYSQGTSTTIMGLIGDTTKIDMNLISALDIVEKVARIQEPYKNANRKFHPQDTVIPLKDFHIGGGSFTIIGGPCSVESREQVCAIANEIKDYGAHIYRGGAFKPRTSPYAFQGMRETGIHLLEQAKEQSDLPIITEVMDISHLPLFEKVVIIQVGARNMQNFELLKELGTLRKPVLLKRGLSSTLEEFLMSAEYILAGGNEQVILCERGIRTFETATRNTLDLSSIPLLKTMSHLPVIVDPSHGTGLAKLVKPMAMAAAACGADGVMVEVHNDPAHALCDGPQSLKPEEFKDLVESVNCLLPHRYRGGQS